MLYLEPERQRAELESLLAVQEEVQRRSKIAAQIIKAHVDAGRRDLVALREDLRIALSAR